MAATMKLIYDNCNGINTLFNASSAIALHGNTTQLRCSAMRSQADTVRLQGVSIKTSMATLAKTLLPL